MNRMPGINADNVSRIASPANRHLGLRINEDEKPHNNETKYVNEETENDAAEVLGGSTEREVEVDLVFVHGICAHPNGAWEQKVIAPSRWIYLEDLGKHMEAPFSMIRHLWTWDSGERVPLFSETYFSRRVRNIRPQNLNPFLKWVSSVLVFLKYWMRLISEWALDFLGLIFSIPLMILGVRLAGKLERGIGLARLLLVTSIILANAWYMNWRLQRRKNRQKRPIDLHYGNCVVRTREGAFILINCDEGNRSSGKRGTRSSVLIIDWCTIGAGGLAAFVMVNFLSSSDQLLEYGLDFERFIQTFGSNDLSWALERPNLVAYVVAVLVYSAAGVYHLVHKPRYWAEFGLVAIICSVFMGSWLGRQAMVNTLIVGAFLSLVCAKICESSTNRRWFYSVIKEEGQYCYDMEKFST